MVTKSESQRGAAPSLLDVRSTGGLHGGQGFTVQDRYLARCIPSWLSDPTFTHVQPERTEDIDVWFEGGRDHHQVKDGQLTQADVRLLVEEFRSRFRKALAEERIRRFVIACGQLGPEMRSLVGMIDRFRGSYFSSADEDERRATLESARSTATRLKLSDEFDFLVDRVFFEQSMVGLDSATGEDREILALRLMKLLSIRTVDEGIWVTDGLLRELSKDRARAWSADELRLLLQAEIRSFHEGPPRTAGDLVLLRHQTLKRVDLDPTSSDHSGLFGSRRVISVEIDAVAHMQDLDGNAITGVAHELANPDGPYRTALARPDSRVLYYGFPHVPFGMLAGYIAQSQRGVALVEHDLENGRFSWRPDVAVVPPGVSVVENTVGTVARLRLSVSARVSDEACEAVLSPEMVRVDLHLEVDEIGRGTIGSEAQAREIAARLRRALDAHVGGNLAISSIHVFAAVPVSVAFCVGQVLAHSSLAGSYVYNFDAAATPAYCWKLGLRGACAGEPCVDVLGRK
jgi:hypothetical protein